MNSIVDIFQSILKQVFVNRIGTLFSIHVILHHFELYINFYVLLVRAKYHGALGFYMPVKMDRQSDLQLEVSDDQLSQHRR
jgi:hypothetical protein